MSQIKIKDLPKQIKVSRKDIQKFRGGATSREVVLGKSGGTAQEEIEAYSGGFPIDPLDAAIEKKFREIRRKMA